MTVVIQIQCHCVVAVAAPVATITVALIVDFEVSVVAIGAALMILSECHRIASREGEGLMLM